MSRQLTIFLLAWQVIFRPFSLNVSEKFFSDAVCGSSSGVFEYGQSVVSVEADAFFAAVFPGELVEYI